VSEVAEFGKCVGKCVGNSRVAQIRLAGLTFPGVEVVQKSDYFDL
jgi:hypothetical protein